MPDLISDKLTTLILVLPRSKHTPGTGTACPQGANETLTSANFEDLNPQYKHLSIHKCNPKNTIKIFTNLNLNKLYTL